jgi:hypothetical protein
MMLALTHKSIVIGGLQIPSPLKGMRDGLTNNVRFGRFLSALSNPPERLDTLDTVLWNFRQPYMQGKGTGVNTTAGLCSEGCLDQFADWHANVKWPDNCRL